VYQHLLLTARELLLLPKMPIDYQAQAPRLPIRRGIHYFITRA
jgi:hypothetical protein